MQKKNIQLRKIFKQTLFLAFLSAPLMTQGQEVNITPKLDSIPVVGSAALLGVQQMNKGLVQNALDAISGKAAGVNIGSSGTDRIAMLNSVRVRGTTSLTGGNDPLVIIDGVYSDLAMLATVYPADIESFTILKNASETAQFGSRGASGVIEVRTKRGHGGKFHIAYDANVGVEVRYKYLDMLDAAGYVATAKSLGSDYNNLGFNTNFQKEISRMGQVQNHHIAFTGGTDQSNYRASLGVMSNQTIIDSKNYNNFVAKLDISQLAFDDNMKIDFGVFGSSQKDNNIYDTQMLFYSSAAMNPTYPYEAYDGNYVKNGTASQINPPGALIQERNDTKDLNFNTHLQLSCMLPYNMKLTALGAYSYSSQEDGKFAPTWVWAQGLAYRGETKSEQLMGHIDLNWNYISSVHRVKAMLSGEYQTNKITAFWTQVKGFTSNAFGYNNLAAASTISYGGTGSSYQDPKLASAMLMASYTLLDRYSLDASLRADASSMVGKNHRCGFFPSVSLSWDMKEEKFLRNISEIYMLKLRTGYGRTGNLGAISSYLTLNNQVPIGVVSYNGTTTVTMGELRNSNPDLRWETRSTFNLGLDLGLLNNRILLTTEYYYSKTTNMLYDYDVPVPDYAFDKLLANIGSMSNSGFEFGLGFVPISHKDMELNININMSWQKNKLISLSGYYDGRYMSASNITAIGSLNGAGMHGGDTNILYQIVGQSLGVFYLPHCTAIVDDGKGHRKYQIADLNNDGKIDLSDNSADRYIAGQATPKMTLGSNISFRYKNYDITLQMNGAFGHKIFNATSLSYMNMSGFPDYNVFKKAPAANIVDQNVTDYWLESGDYLNIDYITLGWNVPVKNKYINGLRLSCSVNNLATFTRYSGLTPMINSYIVNSSLGIDDKRAYPVYRTFSIGVNVQF